MQRAKHVSIGVLVVLGLVAILQNTQSVQTSFLFWTFALPRAVLLGITLVLGFLAGLLVAHRRMSS